MNPDQIKKIVWDVDNTLWDWVAYAVEIYPAMSEVIVDHVGATRDKVDECMQAYYTEAGTMESSWLVQGLAEQGLFRSRSVDQAILIQDLQRCFHAVRNKYLNLYPDIPEVLETVSVKGIENIIITDAPAYHATSRIKHLNIDQSLFHSMHALPDGMLRHLPNHYKKNYDEGRYGMEIPVHHVENEKPGTDLEKRLEMTREEIQKHVLIVGDNMTKDMELARRFNAIGIHALWGQPTPEQIEIIKRFAPQNVMRRNLAIGSAHSTSGIIIPANEPKDIIGIFS